MISEVLLYLLMITCMLTQVSSTEVKWTVCNTSPKLGQDLTLFCKVDNCTVNEIKRWHGGPDNKPLMSNSGISTDKTKYNTAIEKHGFILTILNLTVKDLNVSYTCSCGFDLDKHMLYLEDVYTVDNLNKSTNGTNCVGTKDVGVIFGYIAIILVIVLIIVIVIKRHWLWRKLKEKINGPRKRNSGSSLPTVQVDFNQRQNSGEDDGQDTLLQNTHVDSILRQSSAGSSLPSFHRGFNQRRGSDITDAVVLYADDDREAAKEFITNMEREFPDLNLSITTCENLLPGTSLLGSAANLFKSCRFLFVFVTQNVVDADLPRFLNEISLIETINFQEKNNRLIPVSTDSNVYLPELAPLIPLNYRGYLQARSEQRSDSSFLRSFEMLITDGRNKYLVN